MKVGRFLLVLTCLLVAMSVSALAPAVSNETYVSILSETKTTIQEEVGVMSALAALSVENMTVSVDPFKAGAILSTNMMTRETSATRGGDGFGRTIQ